MSGAADRPTGSNGTPDGRPGREPDSASFETVRIASRRGSPPIFILGFLAVLAGLVGIGIVGQSSAQPTFPLVGLDSPSGVPTAPTGAPSAAGSKPLASPDHAPIFTSGPGEVQLLGRRHPETLFVHGEVYVARVTWLFVSLRNDAGRVTGWASVSVPGAAGPNAGTGPTLRFDLELPLPDEGFDGAIWVHADAYDADGTLVTTVILEVPPATG